MASIFRLYFHRYLPSSVFHLKKKKGYLTLSWHLYFSGLSRKTNQYIYIQRDSFQGIGSYDVEAEKSQVLQLANWELGRISGVISVQVWRLKTQRASGGGTSPNAAAADHTEPLQPRWLTSATSVTFQQISSYIGVLGSEFFLCPTQEPSSNLATNTTNNKHFLIWLTPLCQTFPTLTLPFIFAAKFKNAIIPWVITHQPPTRPPHSFCHHSHYHLLYSHCNLNDFSNASV